MPSHGRKGLKIMVMRGAQSILGWYGVSREVLGVGAWTISEDA